MRVFHLSSEYPPQQVFGLGRAVHDLAVVQAGRGAEVHVITNSIGGADQEVVEDGVSIHRISFPPPPKPPDDVMAVLQFNLSALATSMQTAVRGRAPEVVHMHDWLTVHAGRALKWLFPEARLVLTMHDTTVGKNFGRLGVHQQYCANVERWGIETADLVIVCSEYIKREIVQHYQAPAEKTAIIPCGVDPEAFAVDGDLAAWRRTFASDEEKLIVYVGRLDPEKGIEHLLEAAAKVMRVYAEARLVLAGKGRLQESLQEQAGRLGIGDRVKFAGYVAGKPLAALYRSADLVVVSSLYEPFGIVALEAMVCGTPVIAADTGGLSEIVSEGETGLRYPPRDVTVLAQRILLLLHDEDQARRLGAAGERHARGKYGWRGIAESTLGAYEAAAQEPAASV